MTALRRRRPLDIWPAFVDATASLLMVVVFALLLAIIGHLVLSNALTGRDQALADLECIALASWLRFFRSNKQKPHNWKNNLQIRTSNLDEAKQQIASQRLTLEEKESLLTERNAIISEQQQLIAEKINIIESLEIEIKGLDCIYVIELRQELEKEIAEHEIVRLRLQEEGAIKFKQPGTNGIVK